MLERAMLLPILREERKRRTAWIPKKMKWADIIMSE
jgi:hypothetical protein